MYELETILYLSSDLGFISKENLKDFLELTTKNKMIFKWLHKLL